MAALLDELVQARTDAMTALLHLSMQRHSLLCEPLDRLSVLGRALLQPSRRAAPPPPQEQMRRLTLLARDLIALAKLEGSTGMGGRVFSSKASQLRAIISEKVGRLQQILTLMPPREGEVCATAASSSAAPVARAPSLRDFALLRCLGTGGFAEVWLASKRSTGDVFAIKALRRDLPSGLGAAGAAVVEEKEKKKEVKKAYDALPVKIEDTILQKHNSQYLIHGYFSFASATHDFLVLEYMPGGDLSTMLLRLGFLAEEMARFYVTEVLLGLSYLHEQGVLHHDVKPSNVLIAGSGHIKLADFGLSSSLERRSNSKGTLPYLAPEVLQGRKGSEAVDLWAVGVLIFELLSGEHPFKGKTAQEMLGSILALNAEPRHGWDPESLMCSEAAIDICLSLLSVDSEARPSCDALQSHPFFEGIPPWDQAQDLPRPRPISPDLAWPPPELPSLASPPPHVLRAAIGSRCTSRRRPSCRSSRASTTPCTSTRSISRARCQTATPPSLRPCPSSTWSTSRSSRCLPRSPPNPHPLTLALALALVLALTLALALALVLALTLALILQGEHRLARRHLVRAARRGPRRLHLSQQQHEPPLQPEPRPRQLQQRARPPQPGADAQRGQLLLAAGDGRRSQFSKHLQARGAARRQPLGLAAAAVRDGRHAVREPFSELPLARPRGEVSGTSPPPAVLSFSRDQLVHAVSAPRCLPLLSQYLRHTTHCTLLDLARGSARRALATLSST